MRVAYMVLGSFCGLEATLIPATCVAILFLTFFAEMYFSKKSLALFLINLNAVLHS